MIRVKDFDRVFKFVSNVIEVVWRRESFRSGVLFFGEVGLRF